MKSSTETKHHGILPLLMSMAGTRLELAAIDIEAHARATFAALMMLPA